MKKAYCGCSDPNRPLSGSFGETNVFTCEVCRKPVKLKKWTLSAAAEKRLWRKLQDAGLTADTHVCPPTRTG